MSNTRWEPSSYRLWHGSAPMSRILSSSPNEQFVAGDGCWLEDLSGRRFLDARAGMSNMMLGYGRRDIAEAMYKQALRLPYAPALRRNAAPITIEYANSLIDSSPNGLTRVRFLHTGSAATECSIHMARRFHKNNGDPERQFVIALEGSYHGSTLLSMAASGQPELHSMFGPMPQGFRHAPLPDVGHCPGCTGENLQTPDCATGVRDIVEELGPGRVAAIIVEPVLGHNAFALSQHYLSSLRELCDNIGALLIFDEVLTGFGRVGPMYAAEGYKVRPDILCLSKGITAGYAPLAAVLAAEHIYAAFDGPGRPFFAHGSTTDGHPVSCAAAAAVLAAYENEAVLAHAACISSRLRRAIVSGASGCPAVYEVCGAGMFIGIDVRRSDGHRVQIQVLRNIAAACQQLGVLVDYSAVLTIMPPLTLNEREADLIAAAVANALSKLEELDAGQSDGPDRYTSSPPPRSSARVES